MGDTLFSNRIRGFGDIDIRHLNLKEDVSVIYDWVNRDYAKYWGMQNKSIEEVEAEYIKITTPDHSQAFIGQLNGKPIFLLERYHPQHDLIGRYYAARQDDCGIHLIVAPSDQPIPNFTRYVLTTIMDFIFTNKTIQRVIVEPDIRNEKMFALCEKIGFEKADIVRLPHKTAQLAFCTRTQFLEKKQSITSNQKNNMSIHNNTLFPQRAVEHLEPALWEKVNRLLIKKAIGEFSHELLIKPIVTETKEGWGHYTLTTDQTAITYQFKAKLLALNHLYIDAESLIKYKDGLQVTLDAVLFIKECKESLGISESILPAYIEEIISTLYGSAYKHLANNPTSVELAFANFQTIEQSMMEGHPGFVANNGRIGFDTNDYKSYAPEAGSPFSLLWLAGHKDRTVYAGTSDLPYDTLVAHELDEETVQAFHKTIADKGLDPSSYLFIPIHPWQWFNKLANLFAPELAAQKLICLGYGPDLYKAQQSIRTLFNISHPEKFYTKTSLSILNMGFMRGLPVYYLGSAPEMAEWLENLLSKDDYIKETGFSMLGEIASISYINPYFEEFGKHNTYNKMLASLWRESPVAKIKPGQTLMTMAAFLHIDHEGTALLPELIKASGLSMDQWLQQYLKAYLSPLLHCFYQYDLVFMPHGENLICVMENQVPVSVFLKDITEEAVILNPEMPLPKNIERLYTAVPDDVKLLSIFIDVFDGFFRFMSHVLVEHAGYQEDRFWELVAENIQEYHERHPHLDKKFEHYDLFAPEFKLSCLNRLQMNNNNTMIDLDNPVALLQFQGNLKNPIAAFKKQLRIVYVIDSHKIPPLLL